MGLNKIPTPLAVLISLSVLLTGCATKPKDNVFPKNMPLMSEVYRAHMDKESNDPFANSAVTEESRVRRVNVLMRTVSQAFAQEEWETVVATVNEVIKLDPYNVQALTSRAIALVESDLPDHALIDAKMATENDPGYAVAHHNKAYVYEKAGDKQQAKLAYKKACQLGLDLSCEHMARVANKGRSKTTPKIYLPVSSSGRVPSAGQKETIYSGYVREADTELEILFPELLNPDIYMYVYPHIAGNGEAGVPGYMTKFPRYERKIFALPGEVPVSHQNK